MELGRGIPMHKLLVISINILLITTVLMNDTAETMDENSVSQEMFLKWNAYRSFSKH